jgi:hypothetical protein
MTIRTVLMWGILVVVSSGCASSPLSPEEKRTQLEEEGWKAYSTGSFTAAEQKFREATDLDSRDGMAQIGLAWSLIRQDKLSSAAVALGRVSSLDSAYRHAMAGTAVVADAQGRCDAALTAAQTLLARDSLYEFPRDPRVNWRTLCYLAAKNALVISSTADPDLSRALSYLGRIDGGPAILPSDTTTWYAGGTRYDALAEVLAKRLEAAFNAQIAGN